MISGYVSFNKVREFFKTFESLGVHLARRSCQCRQPRGSLPVVVVVLEIGVFLLFACKSGHSNDSQRDTTSAGLEVYSGDCDSSDGTSVGADPISS